jgi:hypothetical protein
VPAPRGQALALALLESLPRTTVHRVSLANTRRHASTGSSRSAKRARRASGPKTFTTAFSFHGRRPGRGQIPHGEPSSRRLFVARASQRQPRSGPVVPSGSCARRWIVAQKVGKRRFDRSVTNSPPEIAL